MGCLVWEKFCCAYVSTVDITFQLVMVVVNYVILGPLFPDNSHYVVLPVLFSGLFMAFASALCLCHYPRQEQCGDGEDSAQKQPATLSLDQRLCLLRSWLVTGSTFASAYLAYAVFLFVWVSRGNEFLRSICPAGDLETTTSTEAYSSEEKVAALLSQVSEDTAVLLDDEDDGISDNTSESQKEALLCPDFNDHRPFVIVLGVIYVIAFLCYIYWILSIRSLIKRDQARRLKIRSLTMSAGLGQDGDDNDSNARCKSSYAWR